MSQKPAMDEAITTFRRRSKLSTLQAHRTSNESGHVVISSCRTWRRLGQAFDSKDRHLERITKI